MGIYSNRSVLPSKAILRLTLLLKDALNLLDKVLLHELTHTEKGGWTTDVCGFSILVGFYSLS
jgi:hypothetical protein